MEPGVNSDMAAVAAALDYDAELMLRVNMPGLWTAHSLALADPSLRIAVLEQEVAGFGASGRNGGWCSALFATSDAALTRLHGVEAMRAMRRAMQETVDIVGTTAAAEGIDCHFAKGGTVQLKAGEYSLKLAGSNAVFTDVTSGKSFTAPAKITAGDQKFGQTAVDTDKKANIDHIQSIELGGTTTKLEFNESE